MLTVEPSSIEAVKIITTRTFCDSRGSFSETYNRALFADHDIALNFVQDNLVFSRHQGTVRGLHFQCHPAAQDKLVRVLRGKVLDVVVDLRRSSPSYGKWVSEELSEDNGKQLLVPVGFAHGYCTMQPDTLVFYKVTSHYAPAHDLGIAWNDPDLGIDWQIPSSEAILSEKDSRMPSFRSLADYFE